MNDDVVGEVESIAVDVVGTTTTEDRESVLFTIGDLDPSGDHLMDLFIERTACWTDTVKVGVTKEQSLTLPKTTANPKDSRLEGFTRNHWPDDYARIMHDMQDREQSERMAKFAAVAYQCEVEALEATATDDDPEPLRTLLLAAINEHWDPDAAAVQQASEARIQAVHAALAERSLRDVEEWLEEWVEE